MVEKHNELVNPSQPHRQGLTKNGEAVMGMTGLSGDVEQRSEVSKYGGAIVEELLKKGLLLILLCFRPLARGTGDETGTLPLVPHRLEVR